MNHIVTAPAALGSFPTAGAVASALPSYVNGVPFGGAMALDIQRTRNAKLGRPPRGRIR